ncbi:MAG: glycosyltransferase [Flavobacteriales bacterium]|nr:glycosyltransferase [Flavobacteriales bacterium]
MKKYKLALIQTGSAFLPELKVYQKFFETEGFTTEIFRSQPKQKVLQDFDIEWHFMGLDVSPKQTSRLKVHEYISCSIPPFAKWKDRIKSWVNVTPDLRVFQNVKVKEHLFGSSMDTDFLYRTVGIDTSFFNQYTGNKEFDFVYLGSTDASRKLEVLFRQLNRELPSASVLVIGRPPNSLHQFSDQVSFTGKVPYEKVAEHLAKAKYAINWIPNIRPYNFQISTKLLEYCAQSMPIISTAYPWADQFFEARHGRFYPLLPDASNLNWAAITSFPYKTPDVRDLEWSNVLRNSEILAFLKQKLKAWN